MSVAVNKLLKNRLLKQDNTPAHNAHNAALITCPSQPGSYLVEAGLPFQGIQGLQVMYQEGPLQVSESLHPYLPSGITAQPGNTCERRI